MGTIAVAAMASCASEGGAIVVPEAPLEECVYSKMSSPDIRAGIAMLIAAMSAKGTSVISNIEQIDRGYEEIDVRLNALGARITRQD